VREGLYRRPAGAVGTHHRHREQRRQRGDLQHVAAAAHQLGQEGAHGADAAHDVHLEDPVVRRRVGQQQRTAGRDAGIGHDDVDPAEARQDALGGRGQRSGVGHVDPERRTAGAVAADRFELDRLRPEQGHPGAAGGEPARQRRIYATGRTRHDDDLPRHRRHDLTSDAAAVTSYWLRSKWLSALRRTKVKVGHSVVLRPCRSRYQLEPPPVFHTVPASRRCRPSL